MKKTLTLILLSAFSMAFAQTGKVGVKTLKPVRTLDVGPHTDQGEADAVGNVRVTKTLDKTGDATYSRVLVQQEGTGLVDSRNIADITKNTFVSSTSERNFDTPKYDGNAFNNYFTGIVTKDCLSAVVQRNGANVTDGQLRIFTSSCVGVKYSYNGTYTYRGNPGAQTIPSGSGTLTTDYDQIVFPFNLNSGSAEITITLANGQLYRLRVVASDSTSKVYISIKRLI